MSDIVPVKDLDYYLSDPFNQQLHDDAKEIGFDPLPFFRFFYQLVEAVRDGQASIAIQQLDGVVGGIRLFFLYSIREYFVPSVDAGVAGLPVEPPSANLFLIDKEWKEIEKICPPNMFPMDPENSTHDRARRVVAVHQAVYLSVTGMIKAELSRRAREEQIELKARQDERERMRNEQIRVGKEVLATLKGQARNPEFTTNRQVIAMGFILKELGVRNVDKKVQSQFIEFLTGKNEKEIYDRVRELDQTIYNWKGRDGKYVQDWFTKLGLTDLAQKIDNLLSSKSDDF